MYAPRTKTPQARAEYCWLPSAPTRYTLGQAPEDAAAEDLNIRVRFMAEISFRASEVRYDRSRATHIALLRIGNGCALPAGSISR